MPVSPFVYRPAPGWLPPRENESSGIVAMPSLGGAAAAVGAGQSDRPEEEFRAREKRAWEQGFQEGTAREKAESAGAIQQQREAVAAALREFVAERESYFRRIEGEVVSLSLAVARKILHRESQIDPLLLSGLVRVALDKMGMTNNVRLRAHPSQIGIWQEFFSRQTNMQIKPDLAGDPALETSQCLLETEVGVTELNMESQLKEIEQGLFDLLAQRPGSSTGGDGGADGSSPQR